MLTAYHVVDLLTRVILFYFFFFFFLILFYLFFFFFFALEDVKPSPPHSPSPTRAKVYDFTTVITSEPHKENPCFLSWRSCRECTFSDDHSSPEASTCRIFKPIYLHCHRLSLDEPILDKEGSYIDERQLIM